MELKNLMVDTKDVWVDYPGSEKFSVQVVNLSRDRLMKLRKSCVETRFDRKTRQPVEELNDEKFVREFTKATIKNWKGLTLTQLETMVLIDAGEASMDTELEYSEDNAVMLVKNSADFDNWLNETVFDLDNFRTERN